LRIRVTDLAGSVIAAAEVSLLRANDQPIRTLSADNVGEILWTDSPVGFSRFLISAPCFMPRQLPITLANGEERSVEVRLDIAPIEDTPAVEGSHMACSDSLDLTPQPSPASPQPKHPKRKRWLIF
jgi:hypothetical protein